jgi:hypothetical protein
MTFTIHARPFRETITTFAAVTRQGLEEVVRGAARGYVATGMGVTPPHSAGKSAAVRGNQGVGLEAARQQGVAKVRADISRLYATPSVVWLDIRRESLERADAFWFHLKHGRTQQAEAILRASNSRYRHLSLGEFDREIHRRSRNGRGRVAPGAKAQQVITSAKPLADYIRLRENRVGLMASGLLGALVSMGGSAAGWIARHGARGSSTERRAGNTFTVQVIWDGSYVMDSSEQQRRLTWALSVQQSKMERQIPHILENAKRKALAR